MTIGGRSAGLGTGGYWLGAALVVLGGVLGTWWGVAHFLSFSDTVNNDFQRVAAGDNGTVDLAAGDYVVYAEHFGEEPPPALRAADVTMIRAGDPTERIEFETYESDLIYYLACIRACPGSRYGRAELTFSIADGGTYRVRTQPLESSATVAFGPSIANKTNGVAQGILIGLAGLVAGVAVLIVTATRRRRWRREHPPVVGYQPAMSPPGGNPARWTPDPAGRHQLRYWDGARWTDSVADNGVAGEDPLAPAPPTITATATPVPSTDEATRDTETREPRASPRRGP